MSNFFIISILVRLFLVVGYGWLKWKNSAYWLGSLSVLQMVYHFYPSWPIFYLIPISLGWFLGRIYQRPDLQWQSVGFYFSILLANYIGLQVYGFIAVWCLYLLLDCKFWSNWVTFDAVPLFLACSLQSLEAVCLWISLPYVVVIATNVVYYLSLCVLLVLAWQYKRLIAALNRIESD